MQIAVKMLCFIQLRFQLVIRPSLALRIKAVKERVLGVALATKPDYSEYEWKELNPSKDWKTETFDLSSLAGKTIYGVKMFFDHDSDVKDYKFNLGQLSIYAHQEKPAAPKDVVVKAKRLQNAQEAEALLQFKGSADADYYEIYEKDGDQWRLVTGTSGTSAYLAKVTRSASARVASKS